jgi:gamma-glutamyltranspeptidase / glutathione hydrolase
MSFLRTLLTAFALFLVGAGAVQAQRPIPTDPTDPRLNHGPKESATGEQVMVSTQLPVVTQGALQVLRDGGNAVDAMITAIFLQHVNDYMQVSHWGSMSGIYYEAETGEYHVISAVSQVPEGSRCEKGMDPSRVAIGGVIRGLGELAERFGTRSWEEYLQPAIESAEEGVFVTSYLYGIKAGSIDDRVAGSTYGTRTAGLTNRAEREFFMPDGHLTPVGERWRMPTLAAHLRRLAAEGPDYMYTGAWGQRFVEEANRLGHCVSPQDLADFQVHWQEPTRFTYRGHRILGSPPPDQGGAEVGYNLNILENFDLASMGHYTESAETMEVLARTFGRVARETRWAIQDPLAFRIPMDLWLDREYGAMGAAFVRNTVRHPEVSLAVRPGSPEAGEAPGGAGIADATPAGGVDGLASDRSAVGSNHNVIVDAEGNWFTVLHTGHGGAPGIFIDGVGAGGSRFSQNAWTAGPGRRIVLPITAIMIADEEDRPWLAMGTPGSPPQPVTQVLVNILDFQMEPGEAADAPRFFAFRDDFRELEMESRLSDGMRTQLRNAGLRIKDLGDYTWRTGSMQIIWRDHESGLLHGVTDPRRLGEVDGF